MRIYGQLASDYEYDKAIYEQEESVVSKFIYDYRIM